MSDWMETLPGIKDVIDATGETPVTMPRYAKLQIEGSAQVIPDPVNEVIRVQVGGGGALPFTPIQNTDYTASYGQHVLLGTNDPDPHLFLPSAAGVPNGRIGVTAALSSNSNVYPAGEETVHGEGIIALGPRQTLIFQSDGVSGWWIVAAYQPA